MVIGMAMVLASPFILTAQDSVLDLQTGSKLVRVESSLEKIESGINFVSKHSESTKTTFRVDVPSNVVNVQAEQFADQSAVVFQVRQRGKMTNRSRIFDDRVVLSNETLLEEQGKPEVAVESWNGQINISVVG